MTSPTSSATTSRRRGCGSSTRPTAAPRSGWPARNGPTWLSSTSCCPGSTAWRCAASFAATPPPGAFRSSCSPPAARRWTAWWASSSGADDYVVKPFSPRELLARIRAVLRRVEGPEPPAAGRTTGGLHVDEARHAVTVDGRSVELTAKEFGLLAALMRADGRVLGREQLLETVWGYANAVEIESRTVDVHVRRLRAQARGRGAPHRDGQGRRLPVRRRDVMPHGAVRRRFGLAARLTILLGVVVGLGVLVMGDLRQPHAGGAGRRAAPGDARHAGGPAPRRLRAPARRPARRTRPPGTRPALRAGPRGAGDRSSAPTGPCWPNPTASPSARSRTTASRPEVRRALGGDDRERRSPERDRRTGPPVRRGAARARGPAARGSPARAPDARRRRGAGAGAPHRRPAAPSWPSAWPW